jgi:hypothetical protein
MKIKIREWAVVDPNANANTAPEQLVPRLQGRVYGHPQRPEGDLVVTSPIVAADGRIVTTRSGSVYELDGPPDPRYVAASKLLGFTIDEANPIRIQAMEVPLPPPRYLN